MLVRVAAIRSPLFVDPGKYLIKRVYPARRANPIHKVGSARGLRFQEEFLMGVMDLPTIRVFNGGDYKEIMKWSLDEFSGVPFLQSSLLFSLFQLSRLRNT